MSKNSLLSNIEEEHRSALYYDRYEYKLDLLLEGAYWTRDDHRWQRYLEYRRAFDKISLRHIDHEKLERFLIWRRSMDKNNKNSIRTRGWNVTVYANDLKILEDVIDLDLSQVKIVRAVASIPVGVKLFATQPKFRFRTYFKSTRVNDDWRSSFLEFLSRYPDIVPCRALSRQLSEDELARWRCYYGPSDSDFVDYNDENLRIVLALFFEHNQLGKHFELKQR